jgi:FkbM family methyltransferase
VKLVNGRPSWFDGVDDKILTTTNFGFQIWCDRKDVIGQEILFEGQWEGLLSRTIEACLNAGDFAIDIGANIGYETLLMSTQVGPQGRVLAFEPDLENLTQLLRNIETLEHDNVVIQSVALSNRSSFQTISNAIESNRGASNLRPGVAGRGFPILATRLDTLLGGIEQLEIKFVKSTSRASSGMRFKAWDNSSTRSRFLCVRSLPISWNNAEAPRSRSSDTCKATAS